MSRMVSAREIVGRRIARLRVRTFPGKHRGPRAHDPVLELDDGSELHFTAEETESGNYGILIYRVKRRMP